MTARWADTIRDAQNNAIITALGNGALLKCYDGVQPAKGGAVTNELVTLVAGAPFAPNSAAGLLTAAAIAAGVADGTGTATWMRVTKSDGTFCGDFTVGIAGSGADVIISTTAIAAGITVSCAGFTYLQGNA